MPCQNTRFTFSHITTVFRVATHLENLENRDKSGKKEKSGKVYSCIWSITASIDLDTKCAKKRNYLLGKVVHHMKSERRKDACSARCKLCLKTASLSNMGKQAVVSHAKSSGHVRKSQRKVGEFDHDLESGHPVSFVLFCVSKIN